MATPQASPAVSAPNPGDVLPLWNPEIPGEEIQAGRLGIRIRPGSPAAEKVKALEAFGAGWATITSVIGTLRCSVAGRWLDVAAEATVSS